MAVEVKKLFQELIVPELKEIRLEMKTLQVEIKRLDEKVDTGLARLDEKIDIAIQIRERLAAIEAQGAVLPR